MPVHLQKAFHEEIGNLEALGILEPVKDVTELANSQLSRRNLGFALSQGYE